MVASCHDSARNARAAAARPWPQHPVRPGTAPRRSLRAVSNGRVHGADGVPAAPLTQTAPPARPVWVSQVHPDRRGLVLAWLSFTVTFGFMRLLTWLIHIHVGGFGNVTAGGVHLHH